MAKKITVTGADVSLFHVAMRQYGDATEWVLIAAQNGLSDPMLTGSKVISIPNPPSVKSGGIVQL